jgi:P27 family predicted phage terminase small subunit
MPQPALPTALKIARGNPGKQKLPRNEIKPRISAVVPDPPSHIMGSAREEWFRVAVELHRLGVLTVLDYAGLGAYCTTYQKWAEIEAMLAEIRAGDPKGRAVFVARKSGVVDITPLIRASLQCAAEMLRIANEYGFTPASRARTAMAIDRKEDFGKFNGLIAG